MDSITMAIRPAAGEFEQEADARVSGLLDEMLRLYAAFLAVTRRLVVNFTPTALENTLSERSSLWYLIKLKRGELEKTAGPKGYEGFEQCGAIRSHIAGIAALDRTISLLMAERMDRIKNELAGLPVSFRAARNYLQHSRKAAN